MIRAGIVGSTGLVGESLIHVLLGHTEVQLEMLCSDHASGKTVAEILPSLQSETGLAFEATDTDELVSRCDVVFLAKKGPDSMAHAPKLLEGGVKVIDIGGEFRLDSAEVYEQWYGNKHTCPELLDEAVYGLPELYRERIASAKLVANPGCYPTAAILPLAPLLKERIVEYDRIVVDAISGLSGAGRRYSEKANNLYLSCNENLRAYAVGSHKHTPEIEIVLSDVAKTRLAISFVPHLAPLDRGILTTIHARARKRVTTGDLLDCLTWAYQDEPFVRIIRDAAHVRTLDTRGTNYCDISAAYVASPDDVVLVSALDNTVKGAAGQAIQNMNIMFGLDETTGLRSRSI